MQFNPKEPLNMPTAISDCSRSRCGKNQEIQPSYHSCVSLKYMYVGHFWRKRIDLGKLRELSRSKRQRSMPYIDSLERRNLIILTSGWSIATLDRRHKLSGATALPPGLSRPQLLWLWTQSILASLSIMGFKLLLDPSKRSNNLNRICFTDRMKSAEAMFADG